MSTHVFLAVPHYGQLQPDALASLMLASQKHRVALNTNGASLLAFNFNCLWCAALNARTDKSLTHFAMHHADIAAEPAWLDVLINEMQRVGADILSVVIPIKDSRGLTSTGWQDPESLQIRRLSMHEIHGHTETFSADDLPLRRAHLMINTGLFVCDFTQPWVEEACFEIRDRIVRTGTGRFQANVLPEDWNFSAWAASRGLRVFATRKVKARHFGTTSFDNHSPWGDWHSDLGDQR